MESPADIRDDEKLVLESLPALLDEAAAAYMAPA